MEAAEQRIFRRARKRFPLCCEMRRPKPDAVTCGFGLDALGVESISSTTSRHLQLLSRLREVGELADVHTFLVACFCGEIGRDADDPEA